jgi:excisionase family DNA binding protein
MENIVILDRNELRALIQEAVHDAIGAIPSQSENLNPHLTAEEAFAYLRLKNRPGKTGLGALYQLIHRGGLPHIKRGRILLFKKDDLDQYLYARRKSNS